jgi:hypothetical protein
MTTARWLCPSIAGIVLSLLGCNRSEPVRPAQEKSILTGIVSYGDEIAWQGRITFFGDNGRVVSTNINSDGGFRIDNPPLGKVKVCVTNYPAYASQRNAAPIIAELPGQAACTAPEPVWLRLPKRFADPDSSGLLVSIGSGQQRLELSLPCEQDDPSPVAKPVDAIGVQVGDVAPEIEGEDLAGEPFSLTAHRGKVVALVFWANWCQLCREQHAHYGEITQRMRDRPFIMLGVNCDPVKPSFHPEDSLGNKPWRSWWDGASIGGPVSIAYQLPQFPFVVLIDHSGTIRRRHIHRAELDSAIEELVREVPQTTTAPFDSSTIP